MIAADTSSFIAYLAGDNRDDCERIDEALAQDALYLPPVVLLETLCDPDARKSVGNIAEKLPLLAVTEGYWMRTAMTRRIILMHKLKAKLGDAFVAQSLHRPIMCRSSRATKISGIMPNIAAQAL